MNHWARKHFLELLEVAEHYANIPSENSATKFAAAAELLKPLTKDIACAGAVVADNTQQQRAIQSLCAACSTLQSSASSCACAGRLFWGNPCRLVNRHQSAF